MRRLLLVVVLFLAACSNPSPPDTQPTDAGLLQTLIATQLSVLTVTPEPTATPRPVRVLTVCMGQEPESLFAYADASVAARSIRQAIYDGPFDIIGFRPIPVILEKVPDISDGSIAFQPVEVHPKDPITDASGNLANLEEGVSYWPSGCSDSTCAQNYSGTDPITMDQQVVQFQLRPGILWSDGQPLTADDSRFAFELADAMYPRIFAQLVSQTASYQALDDTHIEWLGIPGYRQPKVYDLFFSPLPRHAWGQLSADAILNDEGVNRAPLGWGPYQVEEWTPGDHISLQRNPNYFRSSENLPAFDHLVFRFVNNGEDALEALVSGECDYIDETAGLEMYLPELIKLQENGSVSFFTETGTAWELLAFGIDPIPEEIPAFFSTKETRQAVAMCVDRQRMVDDLFAGQSQVLDSYLPASHPLFKTDITRYPFDPDAGSKLLESSGWIDDDQDPATPRVAQGVVGVPAGTPMNLTLLTADAPEQQQVAEIMKDSLAQCGIHLDIHTLSWQELLAPGPDGPVFGRQFNLAQYGWVTSTEPPCFLFTSGEIPGPYPDYQRGWGGANAGGYSNPDFDAACQIAMASMPGTEAYTQAHNRAQLIFAEDLPVLPLYLHIKAVASRPDACHIIVDPSAESALWNLEAFDYGDGCSKP